MPDPYVAATFNLFVKGLPRGILVTLSVF
jgi:hypothetical protein